MDELMRTILENKINGIVYYEDNPRIVLEKFGLDNFIFVEDYDYPIEDLLLSDTNKTIIYRVTEDVMWNKVYTLLLKSKKHFIMFDKFRRKELLGFKKFYKEGLKFLISYE